MKRFMYLLVVVAFLAAVFLAVPAGAMAAQLEPAEDGLFRLRDDVGQRVQAETPPACHASIRFMLGGEISSIYKKNDKVRKVHNVIYAPTLEAVEKIQAALEKIGNIRSDGRPV